MKNPAKKNRVKVTRTNKKIQKWQMRNQRFQCIRTSHWITIHYFNTALKQNNTKSLTFSIEEQHSEVWTNISKINLTQSLNNGKKENANPLKLWKEEKHSFTILTQQRLQLKNFNIWNYKSSRQQSGLPVNP